MGAVDSPFLTMFLVLEPTVHGLSLPCLALPHPLSRRSEIADMVVWGWFS